VTPALGRLQRAALEQLAASPDGLTTADLSGIGSKSGIGNCLRVLGEQRLAKVTGTQSPDSPDGRGALLNVWSITELGRQRLREAS
jgi:hypothetical protein